MFVVYAIRDFSFFRFIHFFSLHIFCVLCFHSSLICRFSSPLHTLARFYSIVLYKTLLLHSFTIALKSFSASSYLYHCLSNFNECCLFFSLTFFVSRILTFLVYLVECAYVRRVNIWWKCKSFLHPNATLAHLMFVTFDCHSIRIRIRAQQHLSMVCVNVSAFA